MWSKNHNNMKLSKYLMMQVMDLLWNLNADCGTIILDLTVVLNFAIDGVWINFLDDFGERFRERSVR